jgi:hypothetical protein
MPELTDTVHTVVTSIIPAMIVMAAVTVTWIFIYFRKGF